MSEAPAARAPQPSDWVTRWASLLAPGSHVLDLACGSGRHLRWLAARGHRVTGVDRDAAALAPLAGLGELRVADLEEGPWPLAGRCFDAVIVTHYLWRPRWPDWLATVRPGGVLLMETFAAGPEALGRPRRPEFLLEDGELLRRCAGWQVLGYEHGRLPDPARLVQRIAARRPGGSPDDEARRALPVFGPAQG